MSFLTTPPADPQIAAANDYLFALLQAVKLAQARIIQQNLILNGTAEEQEQFQHIWSEIRGMAARQMASGKPEDVNGAVDQRILNNPAFEKFKIGVAGTDDPLMR